jgi:hypothetical protein
MLIIIVKRAAPENRSADWIFVYLVEPGSFLFLLLGVVFGEASVALYFSRYVSPNTKMSILPSLSPKVASKFLSRGTNLTAHRDNFEAARKRHDNNISAKLQRYAVLFA